MVEASMINGEHVSILLDNMLWVRHNRWLAPRTQVHTSRGMKYRYCRCLIEVAEQQASNVTPQSTSPRFLLLKPTMFDLYRETLDVGDGTDQHQLPTTTLFIYRYCFRCETVEEFQNFIHSFPFPSVIFGRPSLYKRPYCSRLFS